MLDPRGFVNCHKCIITGVVNALGMWWWWHVNYYLARQTGRWVLYANEGITVSTWQRHRGPGL